MLELFLSLDYDDFAAERVPLELPQIITSMHDPAAFAVKINFLRAKRFSSFNLSGGLAAPRSPSRTHESAGVNASLEIDIEDYLFSSHSLNEPK